MKSLQLITLLILSSFIFFILKPVRTSDNVAKKKVDDSTMYHNITFLDLSQRNLKSLPFNIDKYKDLEELDLSNNPIQTLDLKILKLKSLKKLNSTFAMN